MAAELSSGRMSTRARLNGLNSQSHLYHLGDLGTSTSSFSASLNNKSTYFMRTVVKTRNEFIHSRMLTTEHWFCSYIVYLLFAFPFCAFLTLISTTTITTKHVKIRKNEILLPFFQTPLFPKCGPLFAHSYLLNEWSIRNKW